MRHPITLVCLKEVDNEVKGALGRWQTSATQSRQSAKRFSSRWNWDSPAPLAAVLCGLQYVSDRGDGYMEKHIGIRRNLIWIRIRIRNTAR